jgi:transposase-like protein
LRHGHDFLHNRGMPWKVKEVVEQRLALIEQYVCQESVAELSWQYEVSRQTIYKWIERYQREGEEGLAGRRRAPHPHATGLPPVRASWRRNLS